MSLCVCVCLSVPIIVRVSVPPLCVSLFPPCAFLCSPLCVSLPPPPRWLGHRDTGTPGHRDTGTPGHQDTGTPGHRDTGTLGHGGTITLSQWNTRTLGQQNTGMPPVYRDTGTLEPWVGLGCQPTATVLWLFLQGWRGGCFELNRGDHSTTSWLHLACWNLPDSQLSRQSKMEPSVAIS